MIDIEKLKAEIVKRLEPLKPDRIILFGSYASGRAGPESDVDLLIVKDLPPEGNRAFSLEAKKRLRDLVWREKVALDIFTDSSTRIAQRIEKIHDQFYREIMEKGQTIYGQ